MNNGGIRASLQRGPVTYGSLFEIQPFQNLLVRVAVRGTDLRAYFERLVERDTARVHVSGVRLEYDPLKAAGSRLVLVLVGGVPLDDAREYTVAYNDFLATGGEGLGLASVAISTEAANVSDLDALIAYAHSQPGGVIQPDSTRRILRRAP